MRRLLFDKSNFWETFWVRGGGQVVSVLAFYSNDPSLNLTEVYYFFVKNFLTRTKIKRGRGWPIFNFVESN